MVGSKRNPPMNRGRQPAAVPDEDAESHEQEPVAALEPSTPTPDPQRPVDTERFIELARDHQRLQNLVQELEDEIVVLKADRTETDIVNESLRIKRDEAITHRDIAIRERGDLAFRLVNLQSQNTRTGAPIVEAAANRKSTKMPDAPMLNDGKEVRFETWETVIRQKLEANADHYPLPVHRKLYVQSRCEGKAQLHIAPRMSSDASFPYADAEDIIHHLKTVFANLNRRAEAYTAYHKLKMKPKDSFTDFLTEFMQLAEEAVVIAENLNQNTVSFDAFTQSCQSMAHEISLQQEAKTSSRTRSTIPAAGAGGASTVNQLSTPRVKREYTPSLSASERETLMREGRCFNCKEHGHMTRDYPKKKPTLAVMITTPVMNPPRVDEIVELEADTDSGKAPA
ncbi:hypothetical protein N7447_009224 [Penicillium robsamsonii]|uniref:uncharacterized protein n=1 Tax=Penicillium robsamsonii TaxID=1792511 RepID=UPI002546A5BA|nr:uncharacterized protein N7447_009224 [Penicillium robsamsonii]KAJ5816991.1 hypothetical protein N7447_009224 [Penicillium robsamsonii]